MFSYYIYDTRNSTPRYRKCVSAFWKHYLIRNSVETWLKHFTGTPGNLKKKKFQKHHSRDLFFYHLPHLNCPDRNGLLDDLSARKEIRFNEGSASPPKRK